MAGPKPSYKRIEIKIPLKIIFGSEEVKVKHFFRAPIKGQNNGGARISLSQEYAECEALVFVVDKDGEKE
jgi:hypothetical protein